MFRSVSAADVFDCLEGVHSQTNPPHTSTSFLDYNNPSEIIISYQNLATYYGPTVLMIPNIVVQILFKSKLRAILVPGVSKIAYHTTCTFNI